MTLPPPPLLPAEAALFLDFDGCLVEIAPRPDAVVVTQALRDRLAALRDRQDGALALISGRDVADLRGHLDGFSGMIAGSHGSELSPAPGLIDTLHSVGVDAAALHAEAHALAAPHPAILVEEKPHGVALHYRDDPSLQGFVERTMQDMAARHPHLMLQPAKMAMELRPGGVGKDSALAHLMTLVPFAGRVPVFAGDDTTDEPAMAEAQSRGGFAIKVGDGPTAARHRLSDPAALADWLDASLT
ncbi:trehalose-phosphatase [Paracoccus liaowanqingii]|uniref:Trehalose 6-phosphate phosphatase n=1 Tax=Paracoccus liaowanqingii TaxID=2560053 RepID=A0A4V1BIL0_9RHOB|nr:trehalose-phosphatase [Paracoccus liaowanqingii]QBX33439.1 trehalose-phosphatase [Paracoccus liaowanqingii]